ncbi:MAG: ATP-dependent DNA ligase [Thaumarchaeota archaeon]|nr:ATP-dependent DNA ligase [Nitrososphaerota archaeon]
MKFSIVVDAYERLQGISGRIAITEVLAGLLKETPASELPMLVYLTQGKLRPDYEGVELGIAEKYALRVLHVASGKSVEQVKKVYIEAGDIGTAAEKLLEESKQGALFSEPLTLKRVYDTLMDISQRSGEGSIESKLKELVNLIADATAKEAKYILRTATGVLRLGVADYTILDACALALLGEKGHRKVLERAYNVTSDLGYIVQLAADKGLKGVENVRVQMGKPIRPMLAERLPTAKEILEKMGGDVVMEYKLDGERAQIHKNGTKVEIFSRRLELITPTYPDVVEYARKFVKAKQAILEGEVVAVNTETGEYLPFQELMHRRRKHGIEEIMKQYPVAVNFFDVMFVDGEDFTGKSYTVRRKELETIVQQNEYARLVPASRTKDPEEIERYMEEAISQGGEGLMIKDPRATYNAGARGFAWIKLKREYRSELTDTIDLVIVGAFHGKGRRTGAYGTYLLAAYDKKRGVYPTISKIGTGFSDEDLAKFPKMLKPYESEVKPPNVESMMVPDIWYRPKVVIETIASEITLSPIHPAGLDSVRKGSGLALRFPKFTGKVRDEKGPEDATTVKEIVEMYTQQLKKIQAKPAE